MSVKGTNYVQVITYETDEYGQRKLKVLKSFGAETVFSKTEAKLFKMNYNVLEKMKDSPKVREAETMGDIEKFAGAVAGSILGFKVLKYLFDKD